jgi:hypothetical protein
LTAGQAVPQAPQFARSVSDAISQPLSCFPSQSRSPSLQVVPQTPASQLAVAPGPAAHALPHSPQLLMVVVAVSQPLSGLPSQSSNPCRH